MSTQTPPSPTEQDLISLQEVARLLGCTERHVHRHLQAGKLSSTRQGRLHRFERQQILAFLAQRTRRS